MASKVKMTLVGVDGNAFSLMGAFGRNAKAQGWSKAEVDAVLQEAMGGDYHHLVSVLMRNIEEDYEDCDEEEDYEEEDYEGD